VRTQWIRGPRNFFLLLLCIALSVAPAAAPRTLRVSLDTAGGDPDSMSGSPSVSANGRFVAFSSYASDLVPGDGNGTWDVFVRDLVAGTTTRVSVDTTGGDSDDASGDASISADGRYVAFDSWASDLVPGDGNGFLDVYVRDLTTGATTRASVDTAGGDPNGWCLYPSISADGRYVTFRSEASDLVADDFNNTGDVFVRDLSTGTIVRGSVAWNDGDPDRASEYPSISSNGRYIAFTSDASNLVPGDFNNVGDVYVRDLVAGTTIRASVTSGGGDPDSGSWHPVISANGRYVAFHSTATNLVIGDGNGMMDIFVRDLVAATTIRASVDTFGNDPNGRSYYPSISRDGRFVAFDSEASNLVAGDGNAASDVFVRDLVAGITLRMSVDTTGGDSNGYSGFPAISANGRRVAFESFASDLITGDGNDTLDVFMRQMR
jgi:Tol biopolymer transport system component